MTDFIISCVLYNSEIKGIKSLNQFLALKKAHDNVEIVIVDNSDNEAVKKASKAQSSNLIYIDNNGNKGLSVAYNRVLKKYGANPCWIMLADDDTEFSARYLENAYSKAMQHSNSILCGVVKTEQGALSPIKANKITKKEGLFIRKPGIYDNIYCINSGLIFHNSVIEQTGYFEERIFLDMLDYWFMDKLIEKGINKIEVVEGEIFQHFSGTEETAIKAKKKRFAIYKKDFSMYCSLTGKAPAYRYLTLLRRAVSIMIPDWIKKGRH